MDDGTLNSQLQHYKTVFKLNQEDDILDLGERWESSYGRIRGFIIIGYRKSVLDQPCIITHLLGEFGELLISAHCHWTVSIDWLLSPTSPYKWVRRR